MGARVEIAVGGENLVRALGEATPPPASGTAEQAQAPKARATALVCAEGLPNLLHELVHAVQAGRLDDDYGIDYSAIPFDLDTPAGRAVLWDELACCAVSCAYLQGHGRAARAGSDPLPEVRAWFREQVGIQPVFYGMEDDPRAFEARVGALLREHAEEAEAHVQRAYHATAEALRDAGADPEVAHAPAQLQPRALWPTLGQPTICAERA